MHQQNISLAHAIQNILQDNSVKNFATSKVQ